MCYSISDMWWSRPRRAGGLGLLWLLTLVAPQAAYPAARVPQNGAPPEVTLESVHMLETREGARLWEVRADRAEVYERDGYAVLSAIHRPVEVVLFSAQGQLLCRASRARLDLRSKDVRLEGKVLARSEQGVELQTEALMWTAASRRVHTDQPVILARGSLVSQGRGLAAETTLERVRIFQNITSQVRPPAAARRRPAP